MDLALTLLANVVALAAAAIAVIGNTWDPTRQGFARLTRTGRVALGVAVVACVLSSYQSVKANRKASSVNTIALNQLKHAWETWSSRLRFLFGRIEGKKPDINLGVLDRMTDKKTLQASEQPELRH